MSDSLCFSSLALALWQTAKTQRIWHFLSCEEEMSHTLLTIWHLIMAKVSWLQDNVCELVDSCSKMRQNTGRTLKPTDSFQDATKRHSYSLGQLAYKTKQMITIDTTSKIIHGPYYTAEQSVQHKWLCYMYMFAFGCCSSCCKSTVVVDLSSQGPSYDLKGFRVAWQTRRC